MSGLPVWGTARPYILPQEGEDAVWTATIKCWGDQGLSLSAGWQEVLVQLEQVVSEHQDVLERRDQREGASLLMSVLRHDTGRLRVSPSVAAHSCSVLQLSFECPEDTLGCCTGIVGTLSTSRPDMLKLLSPAHGLGPSLLVPKHLQACDMLTASWRTGEGKPSVGDLAGTLYGLQDCLLGVAARLEGTQQQVAGARDAVLRKRREVQLS